MRSVVSYVQRGGRMTVGQQRAWDEHWPALGKKVAELPEGPIDFAAWFGREAPVLLEIGSGMGETTSRLAADAPELNYVAVEVYEPGLGQLMLRAEKLGVTNLRMLNGDAVVLLTNHIAPGSLDGARIFFPDPWPKKKHHKRRLVQPAFIALLASRLTPGATLHLATDWAEYADQMLEVCTAEPTLENRYETWAPRPEWRPVTKFENRAEVEGRVSRDLIFERV
ncbi:tRNA (guanosine(46)-N7)-methyltransferase TrmB [Amycolatopsis sp. CA-230715]|uniref:tRNA (guanosine(46)-N7)-methyltransferase TrmB n=1 Tax=Amycolatopsis sp. CA-230715 TaxID=2745196 RepID=UPI001C03813D|nr:tRNA (guanosine(46)-N7)-methyltransferase TrmB [Amycolatopsis sp. CA-230715]